MNIDGVYRKLFRSRAVAVLTLLVVCVGWTWAGGGPARAADPEPILSAAEIDYPPFSVVDDQGRAGGFSVELMQAALAAMGRAATFRTGPWAEVRGWLENGAVEALPLVGRTPEREALFDFTFPYMTLYGAIVVRRDTSGIEDLADLTGRSVAVMAGDNAEEFLRRKERGIDIHPYPTFETALRELSAGRHDAVVVQRLVALRLIAATGLANLRVVPHPIEGFRQDFCFAVREGDRETLALLNEGLAIVMADGTYRHLHAKWFAALELPSNRRIVVGGDHNYPPFEYLDANGRPAGYSVDLTRAIARELDLDIEIRLGPWNEIVKDLEKGEIDVIQGMFYSPRRDLKFDFSPPHAANQYVGVVRRGEAGPPVSLGDLAGRRVAVQRGDVVLEFLDLGKSGARVVFAADQEAVLRAVYENKADCAVAVRISALELIQKHGWTDLEAGTRSLYTLDYCYAVRNGHKALLATFSEGLQILKKSGAYRRIHDKWLGVYEPPVPGFKQALRAVAAGILPLLAVLLALAAWTWTLRRQVAAKTEALRRSAARFRDVFESANVGKSITRPTGEIDVNRAFADFLGYDRAELAGKTWQDLTPPEDIEATQARIDPLLAGERDATRFEKRYIRKDGRVVWADVSVSIRRDETGRPLYFVTTVVDIDDKKRIELTLQESEAFQRAIIACSPVALYSIDLDGIVMSWNPSAERVFGWTADEAVGRPLPIVPPDKQMEFSRLRRRVIDGDRFVGKELLRLRKDGTLIPVSLSVAPIRDAVGRVEGIVGAAEDISLRKQAELRIEHLNRVLRAIRDVNQLIVRERDRRQLIQEACRLLVGNRGYPSALIVLTGDGDRPETWAMAGLAADAGELSAMFARQERLPCFDHARRQGGAVRFDDRGRVCHGCPIAADCAESQSLCAPLTYEGNTFGYLAVAVEPHLDLDDEELGLFAEMAQDLAYALGFIGSEAEREKLRAQLLQSQKMEAVGRLAGGVAHDFNNALSVIIGYGELMLERVEPVDPQYADLTEVLAAARRAADVTRQLLAFARKQTIRPEVIDLNATVEGMLKMLRRLIGEDLDLAWRPGKRVWPVKIDPAQVDQILANLCVNARDAIGGVGRVTIETGNVRFDEAYCGDHPGFVPGSFAMLAVSDDGCGMDRETLANLFEPFFTTKEVGRGTGLGLATVYGIVKQNDGFINVYSEPGEGTTFKIYLRRHAVAVPKVEATVAAALPAGRGETVLVVEDDESILKLAGKILANLGYAVLAARTPGEALQRAEAHPDPIDLLLTDLVMPGMNGRELARQLKERCPGLRVLFMSGYTANVIAHHGVLDDGVAFMPKPFSQQDLAQKVREAMEGG